MLSVSELIDIRIEKDKIITSIEKIICKTKSEDDEFYEIASILERLFLARNHFDTFLRQNNPLFNELDIDELRELDAQNKKKSEDITLKDVSSKVNELFLLMNKCIPEQVKKGSEFYLSGFESNLAEASWFVDRYVYRKRIKKERKLN